jgi:hypothetical protein
MNLPRLTGQKNVRQKNEEYGWSFSLAVGAKNGFSHKEYRGHSEG